MPPPKSSSWGVPLDADGNVDWPKLEAMVDNARALWTASEYVPEYAMQAISQVLASDALANEGEVDGRQSLSPLERLVYAAERHLLLLRSVDLAAVRSAENETILGYPGEVGAALIEQFAETFAGICEAMVRGLVDFLVWCGGINGCFAPAQAVVELSRLRELINSSLPQCAPLARLIVEVGDLFSALDAASEQGKALAASAAEEPAVVLDLLAAFFELIYEIQLALKGDATTTEWLEKQVADPERLGRIYGSIYAFILWIALTELLWPLDVADLLGALGSAQEDLEPESLQRRPLALGRLPKAQSLAKTLKMAEFGDEFEKLIVHVRGLLNAKGKTLTARMSGRRFDILVKRFEKARQLRRILKMAEREVYRAFKRCYLAFGTYGDMTQLGRRFNGGSNTMAWLDVMNNSQIRRAAGAERTWLLDAEQYAHRQYVFEAAHLLDQRYWNDSAQLRKMMQDAFGWTSVDDMHAILARANDHTGSVHRMFRRLQVECDETATALEFLEDERHSITEIFEAHIAFEGHVPKNATPSYVIPATNPSLSRLVEEVEKVWKQYFPHHYDVAEKTNGIFTTYKSLARAKGY